MGREHREPSRGHAVDTRRATDALGTRPFELFDELARKTRKPAIGKIARDPTGARTRGLIAFPEMSMGFTWRLRFRYTLSPEGKGFRVDEMTPVLPEPAREPRR